MTQPGTPSSPRTQPPAPGKARKFRFPPFERHRLDNGLQIILSTYPRGPLVHQLLVLPGGGQQILPPLAGLATLTASLMDEGTERRSSLEIAQQVESLGGYISSQADWDAINAYLGVLAVHQRRGLELLAEIASEASFPAAELERLRSQQLAELQRRQAQPSTLASDGMASLLYRATIYGKSILGTPDTVRSIDHQAVLDMARREITPDGAALILVGDLEPRPTLELVKEIFHGWRGGQRPDPLPLTPPHLDEVRISLVDRPHAPQTELWLGHVGVPKPHPDRAGLLVLNSLLGGKFTSRINLNLRERLGITYGASSSFSQRRGPGPFIVAASIDTGAVGTAIEEILGEIRRLQGEPVTQDELVDTKSYLLGVFPYTLQRIEGLAARLADLAVYDLPDTYFSDFYDAVAAVTRDDLQRLASDHLHPEQIGVVAVGPRDEIEDQLTPFGKPRIRPAKSP